ncbi:MAG: NAD-dependent epimerase/dehydratase family protein [Candidatus Nanohaloarchaea archaeon]
MKVLVAGKGFIGSEVGKRLEEHGHEVKYLDVDDADYEQDITREFEVPESFDVLVHSVGLAPGFYTREKYREVHVDGTENLLNAVDAERVVYLSALGVGEVDHSFFSTKERAEGLVRHVAEEPVFVRPSTVYGEGNRLLELMRKLSWTRLFPSLHVETQPILREDLVEVVVKSVEGEAEGVVNAAGPEKMKISGLASKIYAEQGRKCFVFPAPLILQRLTLRLLSFLPPPFEPENVALLSHNNSTDDNHAAKLVELSSI